MRHKLATVGFSYLVGLFCASFCVLKLSAVWTFIAAGIFLIPVPLLILCKKKTGIVISISISVAFLVFGCYGLWQIEPVKALGDSSSVRKITGTLVSKGSINNDNCSYLVDADVMGIRTIISLYGTDMDIQYGDKLEFDAVLSLPRDNTVFAESSYYFTENIGLKGTLKSEINVYSTGEKSLSYYINEYSNYIGDKIMTAFPNDTGALLKGIFLGDKTSMTGQLKTDVKLAGVSHMTAVSGLHLTLITHIIMLIISAVGLKNRRYTKLIIICFMTVLFMVFFRLSESVLRAGIMLIIYYGAEFFRRKTDTANSAGAACLIILLINPCACRDIGFLLSLSGTIGVGMVGQWLTSYINRSFVMKNAVKRLLEPIICTVSAMLCTLPFCAIYFGGFSFMGIFANLLLVPVFTVATVLMALFALTGGVLDVLLSGAGLCSKIMKWLIEFFGSLKYNYIPLEYEFIPLWIILSAIFLSVLWFMTKRHKYIFIAVCVAMFTLGGMVCIDTYHNNDLIQTISFTDGEDSCIIIKNASRLGLIFTADSGELVDAATEYLAERAVYDLDFIYVCNIENNGLSYMSQRFERIQARSIHIPSDEMTIAEEYGVFKNNRLSDLETKFISDDINIEYNDGILSFNIRGIIFEVYSVKKMHDTTAQVEFLYDYRKQPVSKPNSICTNKRQTVENGAVNMFDKNFVFCIDKEGKILRKEAV